MSSVDKALETQLKNIQTKTGKTAEQLYALIQKSNLTKHGEVRDMLKRDLRLGHGDANTLARFYFSSNYAPTTEPRASSSGNVLDEIYSGAKANLRPIHDKLINTISEFGTFEIAPKKGYISLRRKKQFAMIGPATQTRVEVGLNMKNVEPTARLIAMPAGGMCQYKVDVTDVADVNAELIAWIRYAYDSAG